MLTFDKPLLDRFVTLEIRPEDIDWHGYFTRSLPVENSANVYRLRNRCVYRSSSNAVLTVKAARSEGDLELCSTADCFGTDIRIVGAGHPQYCIITTLRGAVAMEGPNGTAVAQGTHGLILRGLPDTRFATTDGCARMALFIDAARIERALQARLGEPLREMLVFSPAIDWTAGPARVLRRVIASLIEELRDPDGITSDPVARESFTDLLVQTLLTRLNHNYTARLQRPFAMPIPGHLRRAEAFMRDMADKPISLTDVGAAAGCSTRTLHSAFRQFRGKTPLTVLHDIRLQGAREALRLADGDTSTTQIARRFGFTNPSRFVVAYTKRFGERPKQT